MFYVFPSAYAFPRRICVHYTCAFPANTNWSVNEVAVNGNNSAYLTHDRPPPSILYGEPIGERS